MIFLNYNQKLLRTGISKLCSLGYNFSMDKDMETYKTGTREIMLTATRNKLDYQLAADNGLDSKAGVILAFVGGLSFFYLESISYYLNIITIIPLVFMVIAGYHLWKILISREYNTGVVDFFDDKKGYRMKDKDELVLQLISDYQEAFENNDVILNEKNLNYKEALKYLLIGLVSIAILYIF